MQLFIATILPRALSQHRPLHTPWRCATLQRGSRREAWRHRHRLSRGGRPPRGGLPPPPPAAHPHGMTKIAYSARAIFALCSWPFSLKLLWAPIVNACFLRQFGRRKSWLVPCSLSRGRSWWEGAITSSGSLVLAAAELAVWSEPAVSRRPHRSSRNPSTQRHQCWQNLPTLPFAMRRSRSGKGTCIEWLDMRARSSSIVFLACPPWMRANFTMILVDIMLRINLQVKAV
jgi:hypothetical protein